MLYYHIFLNLLEVYVYRMQAKCVKCKFKFFILLSSFLFIISNVALLLDSLDIDVI